MLELSGRAHPSSDPKTDWDGAQNLQFSEDARDPTERDKDGGWYRFRPREEPVGTDSLTDVPIRGVEREMTGREVSSLVLFDDGLIAHDAPGLIELVALTIYLPFSVSISHRI